MSDAVRAAAAAAAVWALTAMAAQAFKGLRRPVTDHSAGSGSALRGIAYSFTGAMLPWRKETASLHWGEFLTGVLLHVGAIWGLIAMLALIAVPDAGAAIIRPGAPLFLLSFVGAVFLAVRRMRSPLLRSFSAPDDYIAISGTALFLLLAGAAAVEPTFVIWFLASGILLLLYMPLGKLRHAVFFFLARASYAQKLGHRGVYPPPSARVRATSPGDR